MSDDPDPFALKVAELRSYFAQRNARLRAVPQEEQREYLCPPVKARETVAAEKARGRYKPVQDERLNL